MNWGDVGDWIKNNAGTGATLVGSLLTGNVAGAVAAGVSLVSGATGTDDPEKALTALQADPTALLRLKELYYENEADVRHHIENLELARLADAQNEHQETQKTIRDGDVATDEYVRRTRPKMAKESWNATIVYCLGSLLIRAFDGGDLFDVYVAGFLSAPAFAYLGLRTTDKFSQAFGARKDGK